MPGQGATVAKQNAEFFAGDRHRSDAALLDTYRLIGEAITWEIAGSDRLLDVGNGGVFSYDTTQVGEIVAVDLFLGEPAVSPLPQNAVARKGNALALGEPDGTYDVVLEALLYHHLVGRDPDATLSNVRTAIAEANRVLALGGRLVIAESCVPPWFYRLERSLFRGLAALSRTPLLGGHPPVMQLPFALLRRLVEERLEVKRAYQVPAGRWTTQFGRRWPMALTPARAFVIVARKDVD